MSKRMPPPPVAEQHGVADSNRGALTLTVVIIAIMAVAIAIDASSVPGLAVFAIVLLGALIGALVFWG